jgi:hypothetical protein
MKYLHIIICIVVGYSAYNNIVTDLKWNCLFLAGVKRIIFSPPWYCLIEMMLQHEILEHAVA